MVNFKHLLFSLLLPVIVAILIPFFILFYVEKKTLLDFTAISYFYLSLGLILLTFGLLLLLKCISLFYTKGKGTLMPVSSIETRKLVIMGPYKYVRNPMIIGVIIILLGEGFFFNSWIILAWALFFFLVNLIYIPLVEEKGLVKRFSQEYINYKLRVYGWIPHFKPYTLSENNN